MTYSLKLVFSLVAIIALAMLAIRHSKQVQLNKELRFRLEEGKAIANEYFIEALARNERLVGSSRKEFPNFAKTAIHVFSQNSSYLESVIKDRLMIPKTHSLYPMLEYQTGDTSYVFGARNPPTDEGT
jgi:hypothetical protein